MAVNRRYYWLQLKEDFFKSKEMKLMRKLPGGEELTIIYLKIMLASLPDEGKIYFEGLAEDLAEELALLIDEDTEAVRMALMFLSKKNLLTTNDNYQFTLEQVPRYGILSVKMISCNGELATRSSAGPDIIQWLAMARTECAPLSIIS